MWRSSPQLSVSRLFEVARTAELSDCCGHRSETASRRERESELHWLRLLLALAFVSVTLLMCDATTPTHGERDEDTQQQKDEPGADDARPLRPVGCRRYRLGRAGSREGETCLLALLELRSQTRADDEPATHVHARDPPSRASATDYW